MTVSSCKKLLKECTMEDPAILLVSFTFSGTNDVLNH